MFIRGENYPNTNIKMELALKDEDGVVTWIQEFDQTGYTNEGNGVYKVEFTWPLLPRGNYRFRVLNDFGYADIELENVTSL